MQCIGRCIDMEVREFDAERYQFIDPRKSDMAANNDKFGKVDQDILEIRNGPPRFRSLERSGVADLGAKGHARIDAGSIDRII